LLRSQELLAEMPSDHWSYEETDEPLYADRRNFYKVEKWSRDDLNLASVVARSLPRWQLRLLLRPCNRPLSPKRAPARRGRQACPGSPRPSPPRVSVPDGSGQRPRGAPSDLVSRGYLSLESSEKAASVAIAASERSRHLSRSLLRPGFTTISPEPTRKAIAPPGNVVSGRRPPSGCRHIGSGGACAAVPDGSGQRPRGSWSRRSAA